MKEIKFQISKSLPIDGSLCFKSVELSLSDFYILKRSLQRYKDLCSEHDAERVVGDISYLLKKIDLIDEIDVNIF